MTATTAQSSLLLASAPVWHWAANCPLSTVALPVVPSSKPAVLLLVEPLPLKALNRNRAATISRPRPPPPMARPPLPPGIRPSPPPDMPPPPPPLRLSCTWEVSRRALGLNFIVEPPRTRTLGAPGREPGITVSVRERNAPHGGPAIDGRPSMREPLRCCHVRKIAQCASCGLLYGA